MTSYQLTKRGLRFLTFTILASIVLLVYLGWHDISQEPLGPRLPPLYEKIREQEQHLSHFKEYEHKQVKYFAPNFIRGSGWGNVMQDMIIVALLARAANRSFVFDDYVWKDDSPYAEFNGKLTPSRFPLSALLSGPMVGGTWPPGDDTPLSVSKDFFDKVCPNPTVLNVSEVNTDEMRFSDDIPAAYVFEKWLETIKSIEDPCLMMDPNGHQIFDVWIFGNKNKMSSMWPSLGNSPVVSHLGWSPLIQDAYTTNRHLFRPSSVFSWFWGADDGTSPTLIPGLLAIHVRRGDFEEHCQHLGKWSSDWIAFNGLPQLPDKFERPRDVGWGETTEAYMNMYLRRCYPSIDEIVERVRVIREESRDPDSLRYLYIMTNGAIPWVEELKEALAIDMRWDQVKSSRDLKVTWEQKFVAQALDMYIAQRAQTFIGNGWSSLTSNVVVLRMAQGFDPHTIRFW